MKASKIDAQNPSIQHESEIAQIIGEDAEQFIDADFKKRHAFYSRKSPATLCGSLIQALGLMHRVEPIHLYPMHIPTIAKWHWDEWGHADPDGSLATWRAALRNRANVDSIPTMLVALTSTDNPIGSVVLVHSDMSTHPELGPWIAGLYVVPAYRGRGLGSALATHAANAAAQMGYRSLYLHTSTASSLCSKLGWTKLFHEYYEGEFVDVMRYASIAPS